MDEGDPRFLALTEHGVARPLVDAVRRFVREAPDHELGRINVLDFAERHGFDEDLVIEAFIVASRIGLVDMAWNVLCPGCGGVLGSNGSLRTIDRPAYNCALCAARYEVTLDELVEINFSVSPAIRRIAAHDPDTLPIWQYCRQMFFSPSLVMPNGVELDTMFERLSLGHAEIRSGEHATVAFDAPEQFLVVFEPVTHAAVFVDVKGASSPSVQELSIVHTPAGPAPSVLADVRPGPVRLRITNATDHRILPAVFLADDEFHHLLTKRPYLTAKRLICSQKFRDLYRAESIGVDQRLKIANLTMLFTDLKGSTELYERIGDLAAYDLVRSHFAVLAVVVREHGGGVVKTIGDAVMATFPSPQQGMRAALAMRAGIDRLNEDTGEDDLVVKIGLHQGGCLAVVSNERLAYFGQTVNIAARVQALAEGRAIHATGPVVMNPEVVSLLAGLHLTPVERRVTLKGIRDEVVVYEIP